MHVHQVCPDEKAPRPLREETPLRPADRLSDLFQTLGHLFASAAENPWDRYHNIVINHLIPGFNLPLLCRFMRAPNPIALVDDHSGWKA